MEYAIKRGDTTVATVKPAGSQQREVMGKDVVNFSFVLNAPVVFAIGDTVEVYGLTYVLNKLPKIEKVSSYQYNYTCQFEAQGYDLLKVQCLMADNNGVLSIPDFPLTGDAGTFIDLIVSNMNRASSGWSKGTVDSTGIATLSFSGDNCRAALAKVADHYKTEFWIDGKTINFTKEGEQTTLEFQYGKGKGLYSITRSISEDKNVFSRLYAYGSTKNLPADYRGGKNRLQLPGTNPYIQKTAQFTNYGLIETSKTWEDIYPHRTGTVSATTDPLSFSDSGMDFDVNDQLIEGVTAKVVFKTGDLAGYEFSISSYNNATKTFTILQNQDEKAFKIPSTSLKPSVGDKYVIVDIEMPQSYITAAENELQTVADAYYDENSNARELYDIDCDPIYFRSQNIDTLYIGDFVTIKDTPLGIDRSIRIIAIERDLQEKYKYVLTLADTASIAQIVRDYFQQQNNQIIIARNRLNDVNRARRNWRNISELETMVFDPEGDYYTEKIKPGSIETLYLAVGAKAQNYSLNGVVIKPNFGGDQNRIDISNGQLVHYTLKIDGLGSVWQMAAHSFTGLDTDTAYYLFARINKTALNGTWKLLTAPVEVDSETGYWNLGVGVLFASKDGYRDFEFNKGMTYIVGDTITTGKIKSLDAQNYFDLTQGKFNLGNSTSGLDWNVTTPDTLTIRGGLVVNPGGASSPIGVFRGPYDADATYYNGDELTYNGSTFKVVSDTPISGVEPTLTATEYKVLAQRGDPGAGQVVRVIYAKNTDPDNAPTLDTTDPNPAGWSTTMPQVDTYWLLSTEQGDYIVDQDGDQYLTTVDGEYIWGSTEVLKEDGTFDHWSAPTRITGRNGIPTEYTEYRFQKNGSSTIPPTLTKTDASPDGWTIEMPTPLTAAEYLWMIKANKLPDGTLVSAWSDPVRTNGVDATAASQGDPGPFMMFKGMWDNTAIYTGSAQHIDAVKYSDGKYYVARTDAGDIPAGTLPTNTTYWNVFAGQFESVATGLLLATLAYIENLGVKYLRTNDAGQRIEIKAGDNNMIFFDQFGNEVLRIDDNIDNGQSGNPLAGVRVTDPATGRVVYMSGNGLFSNAGGMQFLPGTTGIITNASLVGLLFNRNNDNDGISAAVVGIDATTTGNSESWGGYFNSLRVTGKVQFDQGLATAGLSLNARQISTDYTVQDDDVSLLCYNSTVIHITLPPNPSNGRLVIVRRVYASGVSVDGDAAHKILSAGSAANSFGIPNPRDTTMFQWDGAYWHAYKINS